MWSPCSYRSACHQELDGVRECTGILKHEEMAPFVDAHLSLWDLSHNGLAIGWGSDSIESSGSDENRTCQIAEAAVDVVSPPSLQLQACSPLTVFAQW